ncbi:unnamed protein product [Blepharisma stoltei]|uniref:Uncharacterized protein n=1 Tax=Blepharisma stoltei TaxID=1481888 RepID=A0AAU9K661_9CILI|nr:unnamed protein product [Blepharisma stoltei]
MSHNYVRICQRMFTQVWDATTLICAENERMRLARLLLHALAGTDRDIPARHRVNYTCKPHEDTAAQIQKEDLWRHEDHLTVLTRELNTRKLLSWKIRCRETL